ncbi:MAG: hypothetical protein M1813_007013 [Trichoglossum hirsutum]|nr:MAG: hypothetical protein M1813_007013 [Trichoglossum hirsutum]
MSRSHLPTGWSAEHDIFICHLDAKGYLIDAICQRLREFWPDFRKDGLKEVHVDRRLRMLDQADNDYFKRNVAEFRWATKI